MDLLITGGCGFVGGHLAESFVADGHDVTVLDNLDDFYSLDIKRYNVSAARTAADESDGSYTLIEGDIRDQPTVDEAVDGADVVFHQAAQAGVRHSVEEPQAVNAVNVTGTLNCLQAARAADVDRFVLASSSSVYGKPQYLPYDEEHPTLPISPYGASKVAAEQYTRVFHEVHGVSTVILRYFTVYGPRMRPNMAISNFVSRCMNDEPPVVYGDGSQTRDFTYVDDIVTANRTLLTSDAADGEVLNIGSNDNIDIRSLAALIRDRLAPGLDLEFTERYDADAEHTHADVQKAHERIGYEPTTNIRDGVEKFIGWYRDNRDWYEPLVRN
ncbi:NAD-dependent epimerase/dehydratase family protein [Haloplanus salinus]|jgi:UDP-glucose 4-epimerase|uniref:NAD-dependent epimerase/dehydratase family protein n=1 Tax=Haloplanus salinus TaxID=1126245 RepID=A0A368NDB1_9EURY|nr:GDP-mannose 4,6-dehydratase [Haloplanus salinus]RCU48003.1 NAD-dependent epimerase/dehydratase family protein [Haloplanus salinus]